MNAKAHKLPEEAIRRAGLWIADNGATDTKELQNGLSDTRANHLLHTCMTGDSHLGRSDESSALSRSRRISK